MKKIISISLVLMLLLGVLAVPAMAEDNKVGTLSYLNMTEDEDFLVAPLRQPLRKFLSLHGVLKIEERSVSGKIPTFVQYDSLNALLMALDSGQVKFIVVPYYTSQYLCSTNDKMMMAMEFHPEKAESGVAKWALGLISDGYSFMLKEENTALRDEFDAQITAMRKDGTLQKLVDEHIIKVSEGGEPVAVAFEKFEGDPIKVGVSGDLPPMDYIAPDGTFAGFNTAVLAEIGKRLQKNIELVQVDSIGRALALSEGKVDVVFWTRAMSENQVERHAAGEKLADILANDQTLTDEEKALIEGLAPPEHEKVLLLEARDMPAGTIITQPYFTDYPVQVTLK